MMACHRVGIGGLWASQPPSIQYQAYNGPCSTARGNDGQADKRVVPKLPDAEPCKARSLHPLAAYNENNSYNPTTSTTQALTTYNRPTTNTHAAWFWRSDIVAKHGDCERCAPHRPQQASQHKRPTQEAHTLR